MVIGFVAYAVFATILALVLKGEWTSICLVRQAATALALIAAVAAALDVSPLWTDRIAHATLLAYLACSGITDVATGLIYDRVSLLSFVVLAGLAIICGEVGSAASGSIVSAMPFVLIRTLTRGMGIGIGDIKVAGIAGVALGPSLALTWMCYSFIIGGLWSAYAILSGRATLGRQQSVPFAPFMSAGCAVACLCNGDTSWQIG